MIRLFAERNAKRENGCARWTKLRANDFWRSPHLLPNLKRRGIHIKQSYLLAALSAKAVDADCRQKAHLSRLKQVRSHADGRGILNIPHVFRTLRNDPIVKIWLAFFDRAARKIIQPRSGVMFKGAHSGPRMYNQPDRLNCWYTKVEGRFILELLSIPLRPEARQQESESRIYHASQSNP